MEAINESRLVYLYEAVKCGTVRAAADSLGVAPSAVSRQIGLLEEELASALIERHKRGITATEAGMLLIDYFRQQRSHQSDLLAKLQEIRGLRRGTISIALGEGFVSTMVGGPITGFSARHPEISIALQVRSTNEVVRMVSDDEAEIGLVFNPLPDPKVISRAGSRQPIHAIVGPSFPLLGTVATVTLHELRQFPVALTDSSYGTRQVVEAAMLLDKVRLTPTITTNSMAILKTFAKTTGGFAMLSPLAVAAELEAGELMSIPIENTILQNSETHVITRVGRLLSPAASRLVQLLVSQMRRYHSAGEARPLPSHPADAPPA